MKELIAIYRQRLEDAGYSATRTDAPRGAYPHALWMLDEIERDVDVAGGQMAMGGQAARLNRWLGFIQAILWIGGGFTLKELRDQTRGVL